MLKSPFTFVWFCLTMLVAAAGGWLWVSSSWFWLSLPVLLAMCCYGGCRDARDNTDFGWAK
jgi:hypothetical protein